MANEFEIISNPTQLPEAVSTGYERQNTKMSSGFTGIDNSILEVTGADTFKLLVSGAVDVNGTLYNCSTEVEFTLTDIGKYYIRLAGVGSQLTPTITTDVPTFDDSKNGLYNDGGERVLNWIIAYTEGVGGSPEVAIDRIVTPKSGHNALGSGVKEFYSFTSAGSGWRAPYSKWYKFRVQARGGIGRDVIFIFGGSVRLGGNGSGGTYGEKTLFLEAGTLVTFDFSTASGGDTGFTIGATSYTVQNGTAGESASTSFSAGRTGGSGSSNMDLVVPGKGSDSAINDGGAGGKGGDSHLGSGGFNRRAISDTSGNGASGYGFGGGGGGAYRSTEGTSTGGAGAPGIVIIEG